MEFCLELVIGNHLVSLCIFACINVVVYVIYSERRAIMYASYKSEGECLNNIYH